MTIYHKFYDDGSVRMRCERQRFREKVWCFYKNGKVRCIFHKWNNKLHGYFESFYKNGKRREQSFYRNGRRSRRCCYFFVSGKVRQELWYQNGNKEGVVMQYYPNGSIKRKTMYESGKKNGLECHFSKSGELCYKQHYMNGEKNGYCFIRNSRHIMEAIYREGKLHGLWVKFLFCNGQPLGQQSCNFLNGKPHGFCTEKNVKTLVQFQDGSWRTIYNAYSMGSYLYGKKFGQWKTFEDHTLIQKRDFFNDQFHGTSVDIDPNTGTTWSQEYKFGVKDGMHLCVQNNIIKESVPFVKNEKHGMAKIFSEKGTLLRECPYLNDKKNGPCRVYDENQMLVSILNYHNDSVEGLVWCKDKAGFQSLAIYQNGKKNGLQWTCSPNGIAFQSAHFEDGVLHGDFYQFYPTGELEKLEHYRSGRMHGNQYFYYNDGKLKRKVTYQNGLLHGDYCSFFPNERIHLLIQFQYNLFHGRFLMKTESGKVAQKGTYFRDKLEGWAKLEGSTGIFREGNAVVLSSDLNAECVICYETTNSWTTCKHPVCFQCARKYLKQSLSQLTCPYCREPFSKNDVAHPASMMLSTNTLTTIQASS